MHTRGVSSGRIRLLVLLVALLLVAGLVVVWGTRRMVWSMASSSCQISADGSVVEAASVKVTNKGVAPFAVKGLQVFAGDPKPGVEFNPTPFFVDRRKVLLPLQSRTVTGKPRGDAPQAGEPCRVVSLAF